MIDHHVQTTEDKSLAWYPSPEHTEWYSEKVPWFPDSQVDVRNQLGHRPWKDKKKKAITPRIINSNMADNSLIRF